MFLLQGLQRTQCVALLMVGAAVSMSDCCGLGLMTGGARRVCPIPGESLGCTPALSGQGPFSGRTDTTRKPFLPEEPVAFSGLVDGEHSDT